MKYEKATRDDIKELVNLRIAYLQEDFDTIDEIDLQKIEQALPGYFERYLNQDLTIYVARNYDEIVSCVFLLLVVKPMSPSFITGKTGTVLNVYTKPEHRGKGYAKQLVTMMIDDASENDYSVIELKSTEEGYNLYKSVGFEDVVSKYHNMRFLFDKKQS